MKSASLKKFLLLLLAICSLAVHAQTDDALNDRRRAVYGELLGPSIGINASYDARFSKGNHLGYRVGLGITVSQTDNLFDSNTDIAFTIPAEINYLIGKHRNYLEVGLGASFLIYKARVYEDNGFPGNDYHEQTNLGLLGYANVGYRHVSKKGFLFRAGITPMVPISADLSNNRNNYETDHTLYVIPYIGFGYSF